MIELREPRPPASRDQLAAAERRLAELGRHIPPSYKAFLSQHDGGRPVRDRFSFEQDNRDQGSVLTAFLGVTPAPGGDLVETAESMWRRVPEGMLPIADDAFGNLIVLDGRDGRDGPVLFWDHEYEADPPDEANLYFVAPDLESFLAALHEAPRQQPTAPKTKSKGIGRLFGQ